MVVLRADIRNQSAFLGSITVIEGFLDQFSGWWQLKTFFECSPTENELAHFDDIFFRWVGEKPPSRKKQVPATLPSDPFQFFFL